MLLADEKNIREITMFQQNENCSGFIDERFSETSDDQLKELCLKKIKKDYSYFCHSF